MDKKKYGISCSTIDFGYSDRLRIGKPRNRTSIPNKGKKTGSEAHPADLMGQGAFPPEDKPERA
jgi:hypothetical protein